MTHVGIAMRKCMHCRHRTVAPAILPSHTADMEHDGRKYQVQLSNFPVLKCENCGEIALQDEATDLLFEGLRAAAGLLSSAEIRQRREDLNLTQKELAKFLRVSDSSLSRWETGSQMQQRAMDILLRAFFELKEFRSFLGMHEAESTLVQASVNPVVVQTNGFHALPGFWKATVQVDPVAPPEPTNPNKLKIAA